MNFNIIHTLLFVIIIFSIIYGVAKKAEKKMIIVGSWKEAAVHLLW